MTDPKDPWADLAESLGAEPAQESPQPPVRPTPPPAAKPAPASRPASPRPAAKADWNDVAGSLGLPTPPEQPAASSPPPAPPPSQPVVPRPAEPSPAASGFGAGLLDEPPAEQRSPRASSSTPRPTSVQPPRVEEAAAAEDTRSEEAEADGDEPRRRRRRRGGRGRGRRGDRRETAETTSRAQDDDGLPGYGRNLDEERHERRSDRPSTGGLKADIRPHAPWEDEFGRGLDDDSEDLIDDPAAADASAAEVGRSTNVKEEADGEERPRRRRRRRRGRRSRDDGEAGSQAEAEVPRRTADNDEPAEIASEAGNAAVGEPAGSGEAGEDPVRRRRRRRRRRSGEAAAETGETTSERPRRAAEESSGTRRRSSKGTRRRESSRSGDADGRRRRREGTFSRVGEGRDEDDEGLEFLGMDEGRPDSAGARPAGDEELLAESGLDSVRDVPSWVEAIGIVIAGNMDSRKQPPKG